MRFSGNGDWSFYPYSKWPFIENVNRRIWLPMSKEREELNCSQWVQSEDLIRPWTTSHVFHLCVDDLPADWNQPGLIPCPPLSGDSCPSDYNWLLTSFLLLWRESVNSLKSTVHYVRSVRKSFIIHFTVTFKLVQTYFKMVFRSHIKV